MHYRYNKLRLGPAAVAAVNSYHENAPRFENILNVGRDHCKYLINQVRDATHKLLNGHTKKFISPETIF